MSEKNDYDRYGDELCAQISKVSGVGAEEVRRVLDVMGLKRRLKDSLPHLGGPPTVKDIFVGFRISSGTVAV